MTLALEFQACDFLHRGAPSSHELLRRKSKKKSSQIVPNRRAFEDRTLEEVEGYDPLRPIVEGEDFINCIGMKMIWIAPGSFEMGRAAPSSFARNINATWPKHRVTLEKGFWLSDSELTQEQYERLRSSNPSRFKGGNLPVENVTWRESANFCRILTGVEARARGLSREVFAFSFRLPSEAQWEYSCRAGTQGVYYASNLYEIAWFGLNSNACTHPVKGKQPNAWALYDMLGNVEEWCQDDFHHSYHNAPRDGRPWIDESKTYKSIRGGSWASRRGKSCSCSSRRGGGAGYRSPKLGFRPMGSLKLDAR